jgi:Recombination endonuclease VII
MARRRERAHERVSENSFGLKSGEYQTMYQAQGGKCAVCGIATGATKRLARDHNHKTGEFRGLLCGPCNKDVIGRLGLRGLYAAINYLLDPPARKVLSHDHD